MLAGRQNSALRGGGRLVVGGLEGKLCRLGKQGWEQLNRHEKGPVLWTEDTHKQPSKQHLLTVALKLFPMGSGDKRRNRRERNIGTNEQINPVPIDEGRKSAN